MMGTSYQAHETDRMRELDGVELAPFRNRALAFAVDLGLGAVLFISLFALVLLIASGHVTLRWGPPGAREGTLHLNFFKNWFSIVWWVFYFGLATYVGNGRTLGKWLMRIRVVSLVHKRLGLWDSIERALGYGASALEFGFGFAQYFVHPNRRTVHDRIAETIVVTERSLSQRASIVASRRGLSGH